MAQLRANSTVNKLFPQSFESAPIAAIDEGSAEPRKNLRKSASMEGLKTEAESSKKSDKFLNKRASISQFDKTKPESKPQRVSSGSNNSTNSQTDTAPLLMSAPFATAAFSFSSLSYSGPNATFFSSYDSSTPIGRGIPPPSTTSPPSPKISAVSATATSLPSPTPSLSELSGSSISYREGWLQKLGGPLHTTWQWRWFKLVGSSLFYFKTPVEAINNIAIGRISLIDAVINKGPEEWRQKWAIAIQAPGRRLYLLAAISESDHQQWLLQLLLTQKREVTEKNEGEKVSSSSERHGAYTREKPGKFRSRIQSEPPLLAEFVSATQSHTSDYEIISASLPLCSDSDEALLLFNVRFVDGMYAFVEGSKSRESLAALFSWDELQPDKVYVVVDRNTTYLRISKRTDGKVSVNGVLFAQKAPARSVSSSTASSDATIERTITRGPMQLSQSISAGQLSTVGKLDPAISKATKTTSSSHSYTSGVPEEKPVLFKNHPRDRLIEWADAENARYVPPQRSKQLMTAVRKPVTSKEPTTQKLTAPSEFGSSSRGIIERRETAPPAPQRLHSLTSIQPGVTLTPFPLPQRPLSVTYGALSDCYVLLE